MHAQWRRFPRTLRPSVRKEAGAASMAIGIRRHNGSKGRIRNPAPNVINDNINETKGLPLGKNALPIAAA